MQLIKSVPVQAKPITFAPLAFACSSIEEKSEVPGNGYATVPRTLPPPALTKRVV